MNCPMCNQLLEVTENDFYPKYPTYTCVREGGSIHYGKYFSADWSYTRYVEYATTNDYQIINHYDYRETKSDRGMIQRFTYIGDFRKRETLFSIPAIIPIPPLDKMLNKIKLYLLFS